MIHKRAIAENDNFLHAFDTQLLNQLICNGSDLSLVVARNLEKRFA